MELAGGAALVELNPLGTAEVDGSGPGGCGSACPVLDMIKV